MRTAVAGSVVVVVSVWGVALWLHLHQPPPVPAVDRAWDTLVTAATPPAASVLAQVLAFIGTGWPAVVVLLVLGALLTRLRSWRSGALLVAVAALSATDVSLVKLLAARPRPESSLAATSFPSGHTANAAVLATTLALLIPRASVRIAAVAYVALMAWSRTALHAHWLSDVVAGAAIGGATAFLAWFAGRPWLQLETTPRSGASGEGVPTAAARTPGTSRSAEPPDSLSFRLPPAIPSLPWRTHGPVCASASAKTTPISDG